MTGDAIPEIRNQEHQHPHRPSGKLTELWKNHRKMVVSWWSDGILWDLLSGKRLQNYGTSPLSMAKSPIHGHVQ